MLIVKTHIAHNTTDLPWPRPWKQVMGREQGKTGRGVCLTSWGCRTTRDPVSWTCPRRPWSPPMKKPIFEWMRMNEWEPRINDEPCIARRGSWGAIPRAPSSAPPPASTCPTPHRKKDQVVKTWACLDLHVILTIILFTTMSFSMCNVAWSFFFKKKDWILEAVWQSFSVIEYQATHTKYYMLEIFCKPTQICVK